MDLSVTCCNWESWHYLLLRLMLFLSALTFGAGAIRLLPVLFRINRSTLATLEMRLVRPVHASLFALACALQVVALLYWHYFQTSYKPGNLRWAASQPPEHEYVQWLLQLEPMHFLMLYFATFTFTLLAFLVWLVQRKPVSVAQDTRA